MNIEQIKYQTCPYDDEEGILLVEDGDLQYYCLAGQHTFSLDEDEAFS
jgi:hypothetical protein